MNSRLDHFLGSSHDYVKYLERNLIALRQHHSQCSFAQRSVTAQSLAGTSAEATTEVSIPSEVHASDRPQIQTIPSIASAENESLHRKRSRDIEFVAYDPRSIGRQFKAVKQDKRHLRWMTNALALLRDTPHAADWHLTLKEKGLYDILCSGNAVLHLLDTEHELVEPQGPKVPDGISVTGRLNQIRFYAQATAQKHLRAGVALALANFQMFLVISSCAVLLEIGDPSADIFEIVRICIGRDASIQRCRDIMKASTFLNRLADTLYMKGWGLRAVEAILLCMFHRRIMVLC